MRARAAASWPVRRKGLLPHFRTQQVNPCPCGQFYRAARSTTPGGGCGRSRRGEEGLPVRLCCQSWCLREQCQHRFDNRKDGHDVMLRGPLRNTSASARTSNSRIAASLSWATVMMGRPSCPGPGWGWCHAAAASPRTPRGRTCRLLAWPCRIRAVAGSLSSRAWMILSVPSLADAVRELPYLWWTSVLERLRNLEREGTYSSPVALESASNVSSSSTTASSCSASGSGLVYCLIRDGGAGVSPKLV